jgi:hypothetical protein
MAIPPVAADQISSAMARFDTELRTTSQWADWENHRGIGMPSKMTASYTP